eukprot:gene35996-44393_t
MQIDVSHLTIKSQRVVSLGRRVLATGNFKTEVVVNTLVSTSEFVSDFSEDVTAIYNLLKTRIEDAVSSGDFKNNVISRSTVNGATGTESIGDVTLTVASVDSGSDSGSNHNLGGGAIAGIVIAVVVAFVLIVLGAYFAYTRNSSSQSLPRTRSLSQTERFDQVTATSAPGNKQEQPEKFHEIVILNNMGDNEADLSGGGGGESKVITPREITLDLSQQHVITKKQSELEFSF